MSRRSRASFTISWPFIIACIIGYNIFFGEDEPVDKSVIEPTQQVETTSDKGEIIKDALKDAAEKIKSSDELRKARDEFVSIANEFKDSIRDTDKPEPKDEPPVLSEEEKPKIEEPELEAIDDNQPEDEMKQL